MSRARTEEKKKEPVLGRVDARKPIELSEDILIELKQEIAELKDPTGSFSLAVRIEMIFSLKLLEQILDQPEDCKEKADQLIKFIDQRLAMLGETAAWGPYNYDSKINQAILKVAEKFLLFDEKQRTMSQVAAFNKSCMQAAEKILTGVERPKVKGDEFIYQFTVDSFFKNQAIPLAWDLVPRKMKDAGSEKDAWSVLSSNSLCFVPTRQIFIKMLARQVRRLDERNFAEPEKRQDWQSFFDLIKSNNQLFRLMLNVNIKHWYEVHEAREKKDRLDEKFLRDVYHDADKKLRAQTSWVESWPFFSRTKYGVEGSQFKAELLEQHGCQTQLEVLALAFALIETYRRVRAYFPEQLSMFGGASKADKEVTCTILLAFCLQADSFNKRALDDYIRTHQKLTPEKKQKYDVGMEGILKGLVDALFEISGKLPLEAKLENKGC